MAQAGISLGNKMTIEQAIKILDDVTKGINASREVHQAIIMALQTIQKALEHGKG